jgi:hypothetical protein
MNYRPVSFCPHKLPLRQKKKHQTTIFTYFAPFRQSNSCKDLNAITQFQKLPKYPHLKQNKKKRKRKEKKAIPTSGVAAATPFPSVFFLIY